MNLNNEPCAANSRILVWSPVQAVTLSMLALHPNKATVGLKCAAPFYNRGLFKILNIQSV